MTITLAGIGEDEHAPFYAGYVALALAATGGGRDDAVALLAAQGESTAARLAAIPDARGGFRYAPGKWTIREVVGHLADVERVMAYRALRIGRGDATPLPGFDHDAYVAIAGAEGRTLPDLAAELLAVRRATVALFSHFDAAALVRRGTVNEKTASVRALAGVIAGHELHHLAILAERYSA